MRAVNTLDRPGALRARLPGLGRPQLLGLIAALLVSAVLGYFTYARLTTPKPVQVQTVAVSSGPIAAGVNGTGTVVADSSSKVGFRGSGRVASVDVKVGDVVE